MKKLFHLVRAGVFLALLLPVARSEFQWTNGDMGFTQGLSIRYERWLVTDADSEPLSLADISEGYVTLGFGQSVWEHDWTEDYDGRYGEFEAGVHYLIIPVINYIDEWPSEYIWIEGHWEQIWEDGVLIDEYWVDGHYEQSR